MTQPLAGMLPWGKKQKDPIAERKARIAKTLEEYPVMAEIKHPYRMLIIGVSQSGKTTFGVKFAEYLSQQVDEIYVISPTYKYQKTWNNIRPLVKIDHTKPEVVFKAITRALDEEAHSDEKEVGRESKVRKLLIMDDVSHEDSINKGSKGDFSGLAYNAVWYNLSIISIVHDSTCIGKSMRESSQGLVLFNTVNGDEVGHLYEKFGIMKTKRELKALLNQFIEAKIERDEDAHPFLFVDIKHGKKIYYKMKERLIFNSQYNFPPVDSGERENDGEDPFQ